MCLCCPPFDRRSTAASEQHAGPDLLAHAAAQRLDVRTRQRRLLDRGGDQQLHRRQLKPLRRLRDRHGGCVGAGVLVGDSLQEDRRLRS